MDGSRFCRILLADARAGIKKPKNILYLFGFFFGRGGGWSEKAAVDASLLFLRRALEELLQTATSDQQSTLACVASCRGGLGQDCHVKFNMGTTGLRFWRLPTQKSCNHSNFWRVLERASLGLERCALSFQSSGQLHGEFPPFRQF